MRDVHTHAAEHLRMSTLITSTCVLVRRFGPAMNGVSSYPYSRNQLLYLKDFRVLVAGTITHPYMVTAGKGASTPHDVFSGSNFDDDKLGGFAKKWRSEYRVQYTIEKDDFGTRIAKAKSAAPCGVRSEQYIA